MNTPRKRPEPLQRPRNVAASVRARLLERAKARGEDFGLILTRFALERVLYRLSISDHRDRFLLKGAMLFALWAEEPHRSTRDLDLLGMGDPSVEGMATIITDIISLPVNDTEADDGLRFDATSVSAAAIHEDNVYGGVRVTLTAYLEKARIPLQIDIGFGDHVVPAPDDVVYPILLQSLPLPAPRLKAYRRETVVAEKVEAMVTLGQGNSRMKDFFDLFSLAQRFDFDGSLLTQAVLSTFAQRKTPVPTQGEIPVALTTLFAQDTAKQTQWAAFVRRLGPTLITQSLNEITDFLRLFLLPVLNALSRGETYESDWKAGGPWSADTHGNEKKARDHDP